MSGSWSNTLTTSLTLPTGAITGARIVLDGTSDTILIYDSSNNLIASVAAASGTDSSGQGYVQGVGVYNRGSNTYLQELAGGILLGSISGGIPLSAFLASVIEDPTTGELAVRSGTLAGSTEAASVTLWPGTVGTPTGQAATPHVNITERTGQGPVDAWMVGGTLLYASTDTTPEQWQVVGVGSAPAYAANWSAATNVSGVTPILPLQFRKDPLNNTVLYGAFTCAAGAGATVCQLPSGYYDTAHQSAFPMIERPAAGLPFTIGLGYVSTNGFLHVDVGAGFSRNAGDVLFVNTTIPIGGIR